MAENEFVISLTFKEMCKIVDACGLFRSLHQMSHEYLYLDSVEIENKLDREVDKLENFTDKANIVLSKGQCVSLLIIFDKVEHCLSVVRLKAKFAKAIKEVWD